MLGTKTIFHQTEPYMHSAEYDWDGFVERSAVHKADAIEVSAINIDYATVAEDLRSLSDQTGKEGHLAGIPKEAMTPEDQQLLDELLRIRAEKKEAEAVRTVREYAEGILARNIELFGPEAIDLKTATPFTPPVLGRTYQQTVNEGPYVKALDDERIHFIPSPYRLIGRGTAVYTIARYALTLGQERLEKFEAIVSEIPRTPNDELCLDYKTIVVEHDLAIGSVHRLAGECRRATQQPKQS